MVSDYRIKNYIFPQISGNNVGSQLTQYTAFAINGEVLRLDVVSNFTGSVIIKQSGTYSVTFLNATATSGPNKIESFPLSTSAGSFMTLSPLQFIISGLSSGTANVAGPATLLYR